MPGWNWSAQGDKALPSQKVVVILIQEVTGIRLGWNNKRQGDVLSGIVFRRRQVVGDCGFRFWSRIAADHDGERSLIIERNAERSGRVRVQLHHVLAHFRPTLPFRFRRPKMQPLVFRTRLPPSISISGTTSVRTYAVSVKPPRRYPRKTEPRIYSERKRFLHDQYLRLLETSKESPLIFLQHTNFSILRLTKLRKDIAAATARKGGFAPSLLNPGPTPLTPSDDPSVATPPSLTVIRTSIFGAALREYSPIDAKTAKEISKTVENGLAILSLPSLDPPLLNAILNALQKTVPPLKPGAQALSSKKPSADDPDFVPGRRVKRVKPTRTPELTVMGALIEGRVFKAAAVRDVASLPTLDTLRAQLIGLISSPANQIAGVLGQASGGQLARTLEGFKQGLEDAEGSANSTP